MNRRNFILGAAGLAALAVAGPSLVKLAATDRALLEAQLVSGGIIENQTFLMPDGRGIALVGLNDVTIRNCQFIWKVPLGGCYIEVERSDNVLIQECSFDAPNAGGGIKVLG